MGPTCRDAAPEDHDAILAINAESLPGVSRLDRAYFQTLLGVCEHARVVVVAGEVAGYLFAMAGDAAYDGEEFQWFRARLGERFVYIDQVAIGRSRRGAGLGRALYEDLASRAARRRLTVLACEVNREPPNLESLAFHGRFGFTEVGRLRARGLVVSLMTRKIGGGDGRA